MCKLLMLAATGMHVLSEVREQTVRVQTTRVAPRTRSALTKAAMQGEYEVKFLVDGQWRTAPDWPTVHTQHGVNNVLHVE